MSKIRVCEGGVKRGHSYLLCRDRRRRMLPIDHRAAAIRRHDLNAARTSSDAVLVIMPTQPQLHARRLGQIQQPLPWSDRPVEPTVALVLIPKVPSPTPIPICVCSRLKY